MVIRVVELVYSSYRIFFFLVEKKLRSRFRYFVYTTESNAGRMYVKINNRASRRS